MTLKYRIAYLLTPVEFGGPEKVSLNFLRNVDRHRFEIHLVLLFRPWEGDSYFLKEIKKAAFPIYKVPVSMGQGDHLWLIRCFTMIRSLLMKGRFDLVHTHGYFADIITIPIAKLLRIRIISTCHGFASNDRKLKLYNLIDRIVLRFSDKIIAVSKEIKNDLLKYRIKESRIEVILNAVKTDIDKDVLLQNRQKSRHFCGFSGKDFVLGYVGRLSQEKGIKYLIDASKILKALGLPIKVLIIGKGPIKRELLDISEKNGFGSEVVFLGFRNDVHRWIPAIDIFVLPSLTEGTPIALLEAMAHGIPLIASAVGGVPEIIESGREGILVSSGNPEEIAEKIRTLYNDRSLREKLASAAQNKVKSTFDIKKWTKQIEAEYLKTIE